MRFLIFDPNQSENSQYVLVTGATGFIGAHVVDQLLSRGIRVRGATRSLAKGDAMIKARPQYAGQLDFVQINDFDEMTGTEQLGVFDEAVKGVDGVVHTASVRFPFPLYTPHELESTANQPNQTSP